MSSQTEFKGATVCTRGNVKQEDVFQQLTEQNQNRTPNELFIHGDFNILNAELNPICHLLALFGAHYIFNVSGLRVNLLLMHFIKLG